MASAAVGTRLTQREVTQCIEVFKGHKSRVDSVTKLMKLFGKLNVVPSASADTLAVLLESGPIDIETFVKLVAAEKRRFVLTDKKRTKQQGDLLDVFVSLGGGEDKTGTVDIPKLKKIIEDFKLDVNIDKFVKETDIDGNSQLDYREFANLLTTDHLSVAEDFARLAGYTHSISVNKLRKILVERNFELASIDNLLKEMDLDGNNQIDIGEFTSMLQKKEYRIQELQTMHRHAAGRVSRVRFPQRDIGLRATEAEDDEEEQEGDDQPLPVEQQRAIRKASIAIMDAKKDRDGVSCTPDESEPATVRENKKLEAIMSRHNRNITQITKATKGPRYRLKRPATQWLRRRDPTPDYLIPTNLKKLQQSDTENEVAAAHPYDDIPEVYEEIAADKEDPLPVTAATAAPIEEDVNNTAGSSGDDKSSESETSRPSSPASQHSSKASITSKPKGSQASNHSYESDQYSDDAEADEGEVSDNPKSETASNASSASTRSRSASSTAHSNSDASDGSYSDDADADSD